jgi:hypothetical protein
VVLAVLRMDVSQVGVACATKLLLVTLLSLPCGINWPAGETVRLVTVRMPNILSTLLVTAVQC